MSVHSGCGLLLHREAFPQDQLTRPSSAEAVSDGDIGQRKDRGTDNGPSSARPLLPQEQAVISGMLHQ